MSKCNCPTVYFGRTEQVLAARRQTLVRAFDGHPERFRYRIPMPDSPPTEVWINRPTNYPGLVHPPSRLNSDAFLSQMLDKFR